MIILPGATIGTLGTGPLAPILFGAQILVSILGKIFGLGGGGALEQLANDFRVFREQTAKAIDTLKRFSWASVFALGTLLQVFHDFWVGFLDRIWDLLKKALHAITRLVTEVLPRLLEWMDKMQKRLDELYAKYVRPILNYIQLVRRYLAILRAFHIKWAEKLDNELVKIEGKLISPYLAVRRWLGGLGYWMNIIVTVRGILQRAIFVNTMFAYPADWTKIFWNSQSGQLTDPAPSPSAARVPFDSLDKVAADFAVWVDTGGGEYGEGARTALAEFNPKL